MKKEEFKSLIKECLKEVGNDSDFKLQRLVNSMVNTIEEYLTDNGLNSVDEYTAIDILKSDFKANSPQDVFIKACKLSIDNLKKLKVIKV
jgi:hypothetical protein